jgi:transcriptional regulator with XRE-family HTH domain
MSDHPPTVPGQSYGPLADLILAAVDAAGLSVADLCRRAGVDERVYRRWRAGERDIRLDTAERLLIAAGAELVPDFGACGGATYPAGK